MNIAYHTHLVLEATQATTREEWFTFVDLLTTTHPVWKKIREVARDEPNLKVSPHKQNLSHTRCLVSLDIEVEQADEQKSGTLLALFKAKGESQGIGNPLANRIKGVLTSEMKAAAPTMGWNPSTVSVVESFVDEDFTTQKQQVWDWLNTNGADWYESNP